MTRDKAIELGTQFMLQTVGPNPRLLGEACEYRLIGARLAGDGTWSVLFQTRLLGPPPSIIDGPIVVVVDPTTGKAEFL